MNLLKKNKYSIRKYKVGIFSTLIGTVLLLSNPNAAQALTTDANAQNLSNQNTPTNNQNPNINQGVSTSAQNTTNNTQNTTSQPVNTNTSTNQTLSNHNNVGAANQVAPTPTQPNTISAGNSNNSNATSTADRANNVDASNVAPNTSTLNVSNNTTENGSDHHLTLKEIQDDVRHSSDKPELVAVTEQPSNRPKREADVQHQQIQMRRQQIQQLLRLEMVQHQQETLLHIHQQLIRMLIMQVKMHLMKCYHLMTMVLLQVLTVQYLQ